MTEGEAAVYDALVRVFHAAKEYRRCAPMKAENLEAYHVAMEKLDEAFANFDQVAAAHGRKI